MSKNVHELMGRFVNDPGFREKLFQDPKDTLSKEGFEAPDELIQDLKAIDPNAADEAIGDLAKKFNMKSGW